MMSKIIQLFFLCMLSTSIRAQTTLTPAEVVEENLGFYNQRNIDGFMRSFSDSIVLYSFGKTEPVAKGKAGIEKVYKALFESSPNLHSTILHRTVLGNKVIDHESIVGRKGSSTPIELVMIYEVENNKIIRMTVVRE
ncbi:MAG: hypothetical protein RL264_864 [Bacteroidota bacterium]